MERGGSEITPAGQDPVMGSWAASRSAWWKEPPADGESPLGCGSRKGVQTPTTLRSGEWGHGCAGPPWAQRKGD